MKRKVLPIILTSLSLGILFDWLIVGKLPGISILIYVALILISTFYLAWGFRQAINKSIYWLALIILFFALMVFVRANLFLAFLNILTIIYLLSLLVRLTNQPKVRLRKYDTAQYLQPLLRTPIKIIGECFVVLQKLFNIRLNGKHTASYKPVIRGVLLSLPFLFIFLVLLSSADLVFQRFLGSLFDVQISAETIFRWSLIGFITSLFAGAYALIFMPSAAGAEYKPIWARKNLAIGSTESSIILGSVGALFLIFLAIQFVYLFGGSDHITSTGLTYAEYARKGFFELIAVATLSLLMLRSVKRHTTLMVTSERVLFKWLSGVLIIEVMLVMYSAHMRLNLYEDAYGFTTLRLFSHLFIGWLAYAFAQLLYNTIKERSDNYFAFQIFASSLCFLAVINLINPDSFIAKRNIERFDSTGKIDLYYLSTLSEDAVPTIAQLLQHSDQRVQKGAASALYNQKHTPFPRTNHWQSANKARSEANQIFRDNAMQIDAGASYSEYREF